MGTYDSIYVDGDEVQTKALGRGLHSFGIGDPVVLTQRHYHSTGTTGTSVLRWDEVFVPLWSFAAEGIRSRTGEPGTGLTWAVWIVVRDGRISEVTDRAPHDLPLFGFLGGPWTERRGMHNRFPGFGVH